MSQKSPFINPPVESLSVVNFLWEGELIKETDEHKMDEKKRKGDDRTTG